MRRANVQNVRSLPALSKMEIAWVLCLSAVQIMLIQVPRPWLPHAAQGDESDTEAKLTVSRLEIGRCSNDREAPHLNLRFG